MKIVVVNIVISYTEAPSKMEPVTTGVVSTNEKAEEVLGEGEIGLAEERKVCNEVDDVGCKTEAVGTGEAVGCSQLKAGKEEDDEIKFADEEGDRDEMLTKTPGSNLAAQISETEGSVIGSEEAMPIEKGQRTGDLGEAQSEVVEDLNVCFDGSDKSIRDQLAVVVEEGDAMEAILGNEAEEMVAEDIGHTVDNNVKQQLNESSYEDEMTEKGISTSNQDLVDVPEVGSGGDQARKVTEDIGDDIGNVAIGKPAETADENARQAELTVDEACIDNICHEEATTVEADGLDKHMAIVVMESNDVNTGVNEVVEADSSNDQGLTQLSGEEEKQDDDMTAMLMGSCDDNTGSHDDMVQEERFDDQEVVQLSGDDWENELSSLILKDSNFEISDNHIDSESNDHCNGNSSQTYVWTVEEDWDNEINTAIESYAGSVSDHVCPAAMTFEEEDWDREINVDKAAEFHAESASNHDNITAVQDYFCPAVMTFEEEDWDKEFSNEMATQYTGGIVNNHDNSTTVRDYFCPAVMTSEEDWDKEVSNEMAVQCTSEIVVIHDDSTTVKGYLYPTAMAFGEEDWNKEVNTEMEMCCADGITRDDNYRAPLEGHYCPEAMTFEEEDWDKEIEMEKAKESNAQHVYRETGRQGHVNFKQMVTQAKEKLGDNKGRSDIMRGSNINRATPAWETRRDNNYESSLPLTKCQKRRMRKKRTDQKWRMHHEARAQMETAADEAVERHGQEVRNNTDRPWKANSVQRQGGPLSQYKEPATAQVDRATVGEVRQCIAPHKRGTIAQKESATNMQAGVSLATQQRKVSSEKQEGCGAAISRGSTATQMEQPTENGDKPALTKRQKRRIRKKRTDQKWKTHHETERQAQIERARNKAIENNVYGLLDELKDSMKLQDTTKVSFEEIKAKVSIYTNIRQFLYQKSRKVVNILLE